MPNPIIHFEVLGKDKAVLEDFYRALFDWQLNPVADNYSMVSPGSGINRGIGTAMDGGRGHAIFYVEVSNIAETLTIVEGRGGHKLMEPSRSPTVRSSPSSPIPRAMSSAWSRPAPCATGERRKSPFAHKREEA